MTPWEAAIPPRQGLSPPLLSQVCQPKAPRVSRTARATGVGQSLWPSTECPAHTHCLTTSGLGTRRVSIPQGQLKGCGGQCARTHTGLGLPMPIPGTPRAKCQDEEEAGL